MPKPLTGEQTDDTATQPGASPAPDADSSAAKTEAQGAGDQNTDETDDVTTVDILDDVLKASDKGTAEEDTPGQTEDGKKAAEAGEQPEGGQPGEKAKDDDISDEEMQSFKPSTRKRVQELLDQRKAEFDAHTTTKAELERIKPMADRYEAIEKFRNESELSTDEMATGFEIMRLIKQDPLKALDALRPYVSALEEVTGVNLPPDLVADVEKGVISEARAQELSRARSAELLQRRAAEKVTDRMAASDKRTEEANRARQQRDAINAWEKLQLETDPAYQHYRQFMQAEVHALFSRTPPQNDVDLTALLNTAKTNVVSRLTAAGFTRQTEAKPAVDPVRSSETPGASAQPRAPENTMDIIDQVLSASGNGAR